MSENDMPVSVDSADNTMQNNEHNTTECEPIDFKIPTMPTNNVKDTENVNADLSQSEDKSNDINKGSHPGIPYIPPNSSECPDDYNLDVLKSGQIIGNVSLKGRSWLVFGRLPSCHIPLTHPSLSRYHAVLQFFDGVEQADKYSRGWYLYDLESTHGTVVNKIKVPPNRYIRVHVGHVMKFAGSSRLYVFGGPDEDKEPESNLSWSEIKEQYEEKKRAATEKLVEKARDRAETMSSCTWGLADDAEEVTSDNPYAEIEPQNEELYKDDPKAALKRFFDKEGLDMPQYEFLEAGFGKHHCRIELPLDTEDGRPMYAESITSGKKRDAIVACALEAVRLLDRLGRLYSQSSGSAVDILRERQRRLEENEFYSSDEDTFLDRTGQIEEKRKMRMKRAGKLVEQPETYQSLTSKLEDVKKEMNEIEEKLERNKKEFGIDESASELDELDAYMNAIKAGAMDRKTRMKLKARLFELKREQQKLEKLAKIAKPVDWAARFKSTKPSIETSSASKQKTLLFDKIKLNPLQKVFHEKKEESDSDDEKQSANSEIKLTDAIGKSSEQKTGASSPKATESNLNPTKVQLITAAEDTPMEQSNKKEDCRNAVKTTSNKPSYPISHTPSSHAPRKVTQGPLLPPGWKLSGEEVEKKEESETADSGIRVSSQPAANMSNLTRIEKRDLQRVHRECEEEKESVIDDVVGIKYAKKDVWLPPENQSGDGRTSLNDKFGY